MTRLVETNTITSLTLQEFFKSTPFPQPPPNPSNMIGSLMIIRPSWDITSHWLHDCYNTVSTKWRDFTAYLQAFRRAEPRFPTPAKFLPAATSPRKWIPRPRDQRDRTNFFGRLRMAACFLILILIAPALLAEA